MKTKTTWLLLLLLCIDRAASFLVNRSSWLITAPRVETMDVPLQSSLTNPDGNKEESFWGKMVNKLTAMWPWAKKKEDEEELGLTSKELEEDFAVMTPFPWPMQRFAESLTRTVDSALEKEEQKAKPLLRQAVQLIRQDADVRETLGTPIKYGRIVSQQTQRKNVNGKKSMHVVDRFKVVGSKKTGVATMHADKYAKGHIQALRVDVQGVHYDIDV